MLLFQGWPPGGSPEVPVDAFGPAPAEVRTEAAAAAAAAEADADAPQEPPPLVVEAGPCSRVQAVRCSRMVWSYRADTKSVVTFGDAPPELHVSKVPGLWGNHTVSFRVCSVAAGLELFVRYDGCDVTFAPQSAQERFRRAASFIERPNRYHRGFSAFEAADFPGYFLRPRQGAVHLDPEDSDGNFRVDASWRLVAAGKPDPFAGLPNVHFLTQPIPGKTPRTFPDGVDCNKHGRGCCFPRRRQLPGGVPTGGPPGEIGESEGTAVLVLSSARTLPKRRPLLDRWLLPQLQRRTPWGGAVVSVDCPCDAVEPSLQGVQWLIGPLGEGPAGVGDITMRATMALHWLFRNDQRAPWFLVVDDDTIVFPDTLAWVLSHLPHPRRELWYVGHTAEWNVKVNYHGDFAFGGAGFLMSRAARDRWLKRWTGQDTVSAARLWLQGGLCSHDGGDGAICRCLVHATTRVPQWRGGASSGGGAEPIFLDWRGFHQFDIVGTHNILDMVADTCPSCPPVDEQVELWLDGIVSRQPLVTIHHAPAVPHGRLYAGENGTAAALRLWAAYQEHPPRMLLRRACARSDGGAATVCVSFGRVLQVYTAAVAPEQAVLPLRTRAGGGAGGGDLPAERIDWLAPDSAVASGLRCTLTYAGRASAGTWRYAGRGRGGCGGTAAVAGGGPRGWRVTVTGDRLPGRVARLSATVHSPV
eukprot:TRINITY_DN65253_c0_g1_i1.p1 TRINITY_DN65253_c0_g1~~TRINITY_DN65253_c0_g1_i1.p1  ORF type:complete len:767 (+),score=178.82 TRINITY_DN65253_c0_g1_i1:210-2303(+)